MIKQITAIDDLVEYFNRHKEEYVKKVMKRIDEEEIIFCDKKDCINRGQFITCYYDNFRRCNKYEKRI